MSEDNLKVSFTRSDNRRFEYKLSPEGKSVPDAGTRPAPHERADCTLSVARRLHCGGRKVAVIGAKGKCLCFGGLESRLF